MIYFIAGLAVGLGVLIAIEEVPKDNDDDQRADGNGCEGGCESLCQGSHACDRYLHGRQGEQHR